MKNIDNGQKIRITKFFLSIMKEKMWLEEMAQKGYRLCKMTMGMTYTFEKIAPTRLVYEIDRFDIPNSPKLKDINQKEEFISLASDMGWQLLLHDESMNYYFYKEVPQDETNEAETALYNDEESRRLHAEKCTNIYKKQSLEMLHLSLIGPICFVIVGIISMLSDQRLNNFYSFFTVIYTLFCIVSSILIQKYGNWIYQELCLTTDEWLLLRGKKKDTKKVKKVFFRSRHLLSYLEQQSQNGWQITNIGVLHYTFQYDPAVSYTYTLDSRYYVNKRLRTNGKQTISDKKDITNLSYDWQLQSVKDASRNSWNFVCAFKNMLVLYKHPANEQTIPLNHKNALPRAGVFCNKYGVLLTGCTLCGAIAGFLTAMFIG